MGILMLAVLGFSSLPTPPSSALRLFIPDAQQEQGNYAYKSS
jgi:hypothetical protein